MKTIHSLLAALIIVICTASANAQTVGVGLRGSPDGGGLSVRVLPNPNFTIEGLFSGSWGFDHWPGTSYGPAVTLTGLLEYNILFSNPGWRIFLGPGVHAGSWNRHYYDRFETRPAAQGIFGIDGILGVEYIFHEVPIGLSADVKPAINLASDLAYFPNNLFGLSARYYFGTRPAPKH